MDGWMGGGVWRGGEVSGGITINTSGIDISSSIFYV